MRFIDAHTIDRPVEIKADICIVGSGAAGIALANEFDNTSYQVCLLECGGLELEEESERALFAIETAGHPISSDLPFRRRYLSRMYAIQALVFGKFLQPAEESRTKRCTMAYISLSTVTSVMPVVL